MKDIRYGLNGERRIFDRILYEVEEWYLLGC
jgi:hypothetical protein